ncbi:MAG TPA: CHAT domain-containing protein [Thermoanaerobaculia bacterium]|jgi:CHAT domain-containing protein
MVDRPISTGEIHRHEVTAGQGRFVEVTLEPTLVELGCSTDALACPGCAEATRCTADFTRRLLIVTKSDGLECLDLIAKGGQPGRYHMVVQERAAIAEDELRLDAQRALVEGIGFIRKEEGPAAVAQLQYARDVFHDLADCRGEADATYALAVAHGVRGDLKEGIRWFEAAVPLQYELGDNGAEASSLREIGRFLKLQREYDKARDYLSRSLAIFEQADDPGSEQMLHDHLGECELYAGRQYIAIAHFERALALADETGIRDREATYINNIGVSYGSVGEWKKALQALERAAALHAISGERAELANTMTSVGAMHGWLGAHEEALAVFAKALALARELRDPRKEAVAQMNSGVSLTELGQLDRAQAALDACLALLAGIDDPRLYAMAYRHVGRLEARRGNDRAALLEHQRSLMFAQIANNRRAEAYALLNIGTHYVALGEPERARESYERVLAISCEVEDRGLESAVRMSRARLARREGRLREALSEVDAALPILEELRGNVAGSNLRASYQSTLHDDYETAIDILMALGEEGRALEISERARGRGLLDVLNQGGVDVRKGMEPRLLESETAWRRTLNEKAALRARLPKGAKQQALDAEIAAAVLELRRVEREIGAANPRYAALTQPAAPSLREIQKELLDRDTMLIEVALGDKRSYLWTVTRERVTSRELPKRKDLEPLARRVHEALSRRDGEFLREGARLRELLLGNGALPKRLVFVVEGALQYVPFAALPASVAQRRGTGGKGAEYRPLVVDHEIVSMPSITSLAALRRELKDRKPAPYTVAVFADPVFTRDDPRVEHGAATVAMSMSPRAPHSVRLPLTRDEAQSILRLVPRREARAALDFDASRPAALGNALRNYRYIHFATHGVLDGTHPELSGVVLSLVDRKGRPQDGFLRLHDVYNLDLPAELVVLSACQTALGKDMKAEGLIGLTRGFMYAGAARVVSTLWKIDDRSTAELMKRFYEGMLGDAKLPPAAALRAAQIEMWRSARRNHPYHWAAFTLQGEWR